MLSHRNGEQDTLHPRTPREAIAFHPGRAHAQLLAGCGPPAPPRPEHRQAFPFSVSPIKVQCCVPTIPFAPPPSLISSDIEHLSICYCFCLGEFPICTFAHFFFSVGVDYLSYGFVRILCKSWVLTCILRLFCWSIARLYPCVWYSLMYGGFSFECSQTL